LHFDQILQAQAVFSRFQRYHEMLKSQRMFFRQSNGDYCVKYTLQTLLLLCSTSMFLACGQKGDLYMPEKNVQQEQSSTSKNSVEKDKKTIEKK